MHPSVLCFYCQMKGILEKIEFLKKIDQITFKIRHAVFDNTLKISYYNIIIFKYICSIKSLTL